ncbi:hypothetical protein Tco_0208628, partial [Tanacetum coccineum]
FPLSRLNTRPTNTSLVSLFNLRQFMAYVENPIGVLGLGDLPVLEDLDGGLPLVDSLGVEDFFEDSVSFLVLLFFVSLPWFGPAEGSLSLSYS